MSAKSSSSRSYSDRTLKILWGRAAGRCALQNCRIEVLVDATDHDPIVVIGDIAHIEGSSSGGPRADTSSDPISRDQYENLILLCKNCHARLDGQKNTNSVEYIRQLKANHEAWVRESLPERGKSTTGWRVLILQSDTPVDPQLCLQAMTPDFSIGSPTVFTVAEGESWADIAVTMREQLRVFMSQGDPFDQRFAVFPLASISACFLLGYLLTNRPRTKLYQYHRDAQSWIWPRKPEKINAAIEIDGLPDQRVNGSGELVICFHISANIEPDLIQPSIKDTIGTVHFMVQDPSTAWLQDLQQLDALGAVARQSFESLVVLYPKATKWNLFFAGPAPAAVRVGQQISPTMSPPVQLYEYRRSPRPGYSQSILLGETI